MSETMNMSETTNTSTHETPSRAESSRINGAKSHGPTTPQGKARSCLNRTTHGMRSRRVVLRNECQQTYDDLSSRFLHLFQPKDIFEHEMVFNIINARWRIRRLECAGTANLELAIEESRPQFQEKYENIDATHEHALAYRAIAKAFGGVDIMARHEDRQHRIIDRSYRLLARHRGKSGALPSSELLLQAEEGLPEDNFPLVNSLETEIDPSESAFEPEPPPPIIVKPSPVEESRKLPQPEEEWDAMSDNPAVEAALAPLFSVLKKYPELRQQLCDAIEKDMKGKAA